ncbi:MAG: transcription termination/antitermination protein NusA [Clostridia bacterium]|nr:transcription termination/antitermination protein NusA [Clostridia bacterium]
MAKVKKDKKNSPNYAEFFDALEELEKDGTIDVAMLIDALESGLESAYKKEYGETRGVKVKLDPITKTVTVTAYREVVEELTDPDKQITVEELKEICEDEGREYNYNIGDVITEDITPNSFTRIAAQTAKQVVMQRITEARRSHVLNEMSDREGEIMNAIVRRIDNGNVYTEMVQTQMEGIMMPSDQVRGERYNLGDQIKVFVKKLRTTAKGAQVVISRSSTGFVRKLFELEVPEIREGVVVIKGIVREAGYRTKIAVYSEDPSIDPVGACIGARGVRVNAIVAELGGEKIDVVEWCEDSLEYIARSLSPAKVLMVQVNDDEKSAKVIVPDDKLSLAIGKEGQNARLAARLTGWKIDVKPYSTIAEISDEI